MVERMMRRQGRGETLGTRGEQMWIVYVNQWLLWCALISNAHVYERDEHYLLQKLLKLGVRVAHTCAAIVSVDFRVAGTMVVCI